VGLARDLVDLLEQLRSEVGTHVFSPGDWKEVFAKPGAASAAQRIGMLGVSEPAGVLRLCLQALEVQRSELERRSTNAEFVATLPAGTGGVARSTRHVVREMLAAATQEVILLGFELTDAGMVQHLATTARRGAVVVVICDRERGVPQRLRASWPQGCPLPTVYQDRPRPNPGPYSSMHAKCLLVDGADLLVTSANFTFHGLNENIEMGVRLRGHQAAEARIIFNYLVTSDAVEKVA
jgi:phosphatidylserine/phosphatidylglycerophosphate/cardiolipin synthase-like enzyme